VIGSKFIKALVIGSKFIKAIVIGPKFYFVLSNVTTCHGTL